MPRPLHRVIHTCLAGLLLGQGVGSMAAEVQFQDMKLQIKGALTLGAMARTSAPDSNLILAGNGLAAGVEATATAGRNQDDGNLNYAEGDLVSGVLKGWLSADLKRGQGGLFVRAKAWNDFTQADADVPWGNSINGYAADRPLDDQGASRRARFSGALIEDVYLYGDLMLGEMPLKARLGWQTLDWGARASIGGGLSAIAPLDLPALRRPGAQPEEMRIAVPAAFGHLDLSKQLAAEAFYQFGFRPTEQYLCGTFFASADYAAPGCNQVMLGGTNDRIGLPAGLYASRAATVEADDAGQYGLGLIYKAESINTEFGAYLSNVHSRIPMYGAIKNSNPGGAPLIPPSSPGDVQYFAEYPEDLRTFSLTFLTRQPSYTVHGELSHRNNQPIQLSTIDLLYAFTSNSAPTPLRAEEQATPAGTKFSGYDRYGVTHIQLGAVKPMPKFLGADSASLAGELGMKYVHNLPDDSLRRYLRSDIYGQSAFQGWDCTGSAAACNTEGYVTPFSWGYRARLALTYKNVAAGLDLSPNLNVAHDVRGWSPDGIFSQDRKILGLGLRADIARDYFVDLSLQHAVGGYYNNTRDRSWLALAAGVKF